MAVFGVPISPFDLTESRSDLSRIDRTDKAAVDSLACDHGGLERAKVNQHTKRNAINEAYAQTVREQRALETKMIALQKELEGIDGVNKIGKLPALECKSPH